MAVFKQILAIGVYHVENGANDFDTWSKLMADDLGPNVRPFLRELMEWSLALARKNTAASHLKINCWDFYHCGRQAGRDNENKQGPCPACAEIKLDGIHGGTNGGRACWVVNGTRCGGLITRMLVPRYLICKFCRFKKSVLNEERGTFIVSDYFMRSLIS